MSEEKPDKVEIPIGDPYLEELDPELHRANEAAHRVATAALEYHLLLWRQSRAELHFFGDDKRHADAQNELRDALIEYEKLRGSRTTGEQADG